MKKIKILFICPGYGKVSRGVEIFLKELLRRIHYDRFEVEVLGRMDGLERSARIRKIATIDRSRFQPLHRLKLLKLLKLVRLGSAAELESFFFSLSAVHFLSRNGFDIVVPMGGYWTFLVSSLFKKKAAILSIGHAGPVKCEAKLADEFVALTDHSYDYAVQNRLYSHVSLIPNGVDLAIFHPPVRRHSGRTTILCVAAFSEDKRHDLLFDVMTFLDRSIRLVCVGHGKVPAVLANHPACTSHSIEFRSASHAEMPELYRQADVFTLPSPEEAFGIVLLEALASGLNAVVADAPRQRFVLGSAGFYCNVFDLKEYSETLVRALTCQQISTNVMQAAKFDWQAVTGQYEAVFQRIAVTRVRLTEP